MSQFLVKLAVKKIFDETKLNKFGTEDPYCSEIIIDYAGTGKKVIKKVKKQAPIGISLHDARIYERVKRRAYRMDLLFNFCGLRIGLAHIIGFVPVIGPICCIFLSLMIYRLCLQVEGGIPIDIQIKMVLNIAIDFAIGMIPIIGDFIDMYYKSNSRNLLLLEKHLINVGELNRSATEPREIQQENVQVYSDNIPTHVTTGRKEE
ncbi:hypothetical protein DASC09_038230 [Saccharomycopsis crataegensis]|uniref:Uncharacterized protein n=1 Tax=Saccharomycopsis crataegensis TaxID=43959 RepID=A0AAV5QNP5_9ASCO|nr:hypothetical protein DASC09_038230 [Saccharomycopsis crataegensis]